MSFDKKGSRLFGRFFFGPSEGLFGTSWSEGTARVSGGGVITGPYFENSRFPEFPIPPREVPFLHRGAHRRHLGLCGRPCNGFGSLLPGASSQICPRDWCSHFLLVFLL